MALPLLRTKLYIAPARAGLVARQRLLDRLNEGCQSGCRLVLVSASAGYGKTTLLAQWAAGWDGRVAWLTLDEEDNDPIRFLAYLVAALQTVDASIGQDVWDALQSAQPPSMDELLTLLVNQMDAIPNRLALVLDDYHLISCVPIHQAVAFLLEHLPADVHLVLATRADPLLPLARLRGRGQLVELRQQDLGFTLEEASAFLQQGMGLELTPSDVAALDARVEGWIAGLQMAALALQGPVSAGGPPDPAAFVRAFSGSHQYVLDYLVEEVLNHQPDKVHDFLLKTSVLERLTGPLCDAVTEQPGGQAMLERLARANLFLVPLDDERRWYRYHHLFADLLRVRLQQALPGQVTALYLRAATWHEQNGLPVEAVHCAVAAQDFERAADLIERVGGELLERNERAAMHSLLDKLPREVVRSRPWLCVYYAEALIRTGQVDEMEALLRCAEERAPAEAPGLLSGWIALARARVHEFHGNLSAGVVQATLAHQFLPPGHPLCGEAAVLLGELLYLDGDMQGADRAWMEVLQLARLTNQHWVISVALSSLALVRLIQGQLHAATDIYQEMLRLLMEDNRSRWGRELAIALVGLGDVYRERNDLALAGRYILDGQETIHRRGNAGDRVYGYTMLGRLRWAQGDIDGAREAFRQAQELAGSRAMYPDARSGLQADLTRFLLAQGDLTAAARIVQELPLATDQMPGLVREQNQITRARLLIAQQRPAEAVQMLVPLAVAAQAGERNGRLIETLILRALAVQAQGEMAQALVTLQQALALAEPEGYLRIFLDEGPALVALLHRGDQRGLWGSARIAAYVGRLLAAIDEESQPALSAGGQPFPAGGTKPATLIEPLSERELEVLRLMAAGLSNQEIADKLVVAMGTVKAHVHNVYGKLGAQRRAQAIAIAHELRLI